MSAQAEGAGGFEFLEHERQDFGAIGAGDVGDRHAVGGGVPAAVDVPAQHALRARGRRVEPLRRPGDPVRLVRQRHEGEQFHPVGHAVPADGAVAIGRDNEPAVAADVDRPDDAGHGAAPELRALRIEGAQGPLCPQHEAVAIRMHREATGHLILIQRQLLAAERRVVLVVASARPASRSDAGPPSRCRRQAPGPATAWRGRTAPAMCRTAGSRSRRGSRRSTRKSGRTDRGNRRPAARAASAACRPAPAGRARGRRRRPADRRRAAEPSPSRYSNQPAARVARPCRHRPRQARGGRRPVT